VYLRARGVAGESCSAHTLFVRMQVILCALRAIGVLRSCVRAATPD
jgi:hypothetical protein